MKTFDIEVINSVVNSVAISVENVYESTSMYGLENAISAEVKYQLYVGLSNVAEYLNLSEHSIANLVETVYTANKSRFLEMAHTAFEGEYA